MIGYGIVERLGVYRSYLIFKKLIISYEITSFSQYAWVYYFKEDIEYQNEDECLKIMSLGHREIRDINYNIIFKLDVSNKKMKYEYMDYEQTIKFYFFYPDDLEYYIISIKE